MNYTYKPIGGKIVTVKKDTELITWEALGYKKPLSKLVTQSFYIRNEDAKDIYVRVNGGDDMLLKPNEMFNFKDLTYVESCIVLTDASVRWGCLVR